MILIQVTELNEVKTANLAEGIFTGAEVLENKTIFRIAGNEGNKVVRHQVKVVDSNTMDSLHPIDKSFEEIYFSSPLYPIITYKWHTADAIELSVANISDTTYKSIEKWYDPRILL